jgi:hypothetical protein
MYSKKGLIAALKVNLFLLTIREPGTFLRLVRLGPKKIFYLFKLLTEIHIIL